MLLGLCSRFLGEDRMEVLAGLADQGDLNRVDLKIGDISSTAISFLQADITAANLAKMNADAQKADMVLGFLNVIFQTLGTMAVFACADRGEKEAVITGTLATLPQTQGLLDRVGELYGFRFRIPRQAAFATALGAAMWGNSSYTGAPRL